MKKRVAPVLGGVDTPEGRAGPIAGIPLGRISKPQDIANAACFLASDEAEFLTVSNSRGRLGSWN
jgi:3-oxoacyl-[acyl-carrier protein] reductase